MAHVAKRRGGDTEPSFCVHHQYSGLFLRLRRRSILVHFPDSAHESDNETAMRFDHDDRPASPTKNLSQTQHRTTQFSGARLAIGRRLCWRQWQLLGRASPCQLTAGVGGLLVDGRGTAAGASATVDDVALGPTGAVSLDRFGRLIRHRYRAHPPHL